MSLRPFRLEYLLSGSTVLGTGTLIIYKSTTLFSDPKRVDKDVDFFSLNHKFKQNTLTEEMRKGFDASIKDYRKYFPAPKIIRYKDENNKAKKINLEWLSGISVGGWKNKGSKKVFHSGKYYEVKIWSKLHKKGKNKCRYTWNEVKNPKKAAKIQINTQMIEIIKDLQNKCNKETID